MRLVVNPEKMVIAEARRTYTYLGLFGYRVDAVVVNRIIPEDVTDPYFGKWKDIQAEHLATVRESFEPVPILTARLFDREMVGVPLLEEMGQRGVRRARRSPTSCTEDDPIRVRKRGTGYVLSMRLPFVVARGHGHPPARRGAVRPRRDLQAQPDPAADAPADGGPRGELRRGPLEIIFARLPGSEPAAAPRGRSKHG